MTRLKTPMLMRRSGSWKMPVSLSFRSADWRTTAQIAPLRTRVRCSILQACGIRCAAYCAKATGAASRAKAPSFTWDTTFTCMSECLILVGRHRQPRRIWGCSSNHSLPRICAPLETDDALGLVRCLQILEHGDTGGQDRPVEQWIKRTHHAAPNDTGSGPRV